MSDVECAKNSNRGRCLICFRDDVPLELHPSGSYLCHDDIGSTARLSLRFKSHHQEEFSEGIASLASDVAKLKSELMAMHGYLPEEFLPRWETVRALNVRILEGSLGLLRKQSLDIVRLEVLLGAYEVQPRESFDV